MQWSGFLTLFCVLLCGELFAQTILPNTYVIKFNNDIADPSQAINLFQQSLSKAKIQTNRSVAITAKRFFETNDTTRKNFQWKKYIIVKLSGLQLNDQEIQLLNSDPAIDYVHPSYIYKVYSTPNDSAYSSQWNLRRIGISSLLENGIIHSSLPSVKVGVIDTGIDEYHPDLMESIWINAGETGIDLNGNDKRSNGIDDDNNGFNDDWRGYDFVDFPTADIGDWSERDNDPMDENGHGTAVSGIIGAQTNNRKGIVGVFPCKIVPLRAFGANGNGSDIDISSAIIYATDNDVQVINMSFGDVVQSPLLHDAIKYAHSKNITMVASSGNDGSNKPHYPSDFTEVISTGSVGSFDSRSFFSSYSPSLDLVAPGEQIPTTQLGGGYTDSFSGTSAAAPHVAGVSALLKSFQEKEKQNNPGYVELSNEEIRGILLHSADDVGEKGWDKFTGAGVVNAARAMETIRGNQAFIISPVLDEIITQSSVPIIITASSPYLTAVNIQYAVGENPSSWVNIFSSSNKIFIRDTIIHWDITTLINGVYTLRLQIKNSKGNDIETRQRVFINTDTPKILSFRFRDSVIIGNEYGGLIEARFDRNTRGFLHYKKKGETQYKIIQSDGLQKNHVFILSRMDFQPLQDYEFYTEFIENSNSQRPVRFPANVLVGFDHFTFRIRALPFTSPGYIQKPYSLPSGFLLNPVQNINGRQTLILNEYDQKNNFGKLKAFQFNGSSFVVKDSSVRSWVPRGFVKDDGNGNPAILVQDRGVSQLLRVDTVNGKFFNQPIWGDSSDVWASQIIDLDGDNKPEIVARSNSEYLIYKNLGNNHFEITTRLPNPTQPLFGEARNQFGAPRSIVGDFTNSGKKEIVFADYDGDVVMYRQTSPTSLDFSLAWIDSSDLFEMSDYIAAGDFNGDGLQDFAVAGHSNLDWNVDREYDAPVWTVKVFSHIASDAPGSVSKIWEQHLVGVKAGSGYDNGLTTGKRNVAADCDELFLTLNPYLYVFNLNPIANRFIPVFFHQSQSNAVVVHDFDGDNLNEFGFHTNDMTEFWSMPLGSTPPGTPVGLEVTPLSATKIRLRWSSSTTTHNVYRGTHRDLLLLAATFNGIPEWIDTTVSLNSKYYYAVTSVGNGESSKSSVVSIIPHQAPTIVTVSQSSLSQISVTISFDVSSENLLTTFFLLDNICRSSSVVWQSARSLLVTFPQSISAGNHTLKIEQLTDASGMFADTTQIFQFTASQTLAGLFFIRSVNLIGTSKLRLDFSEPVQNVSAKVLANYFVYNIAKHFTVQSVIFDSTQPAFVILDAGNVNLAEFALRIEVKVSENLLSAANVKLNEGKGQTVSVALETRSIDNVVIFPNPVRFQSGRQNTIRFVNVPHDCRIAIYSLNGEKVKIFDDLTTSDGVAWNLRDNNNELVSSGVYLYRIEQMDASNIVVNSTVGKFAVIR